MQTADDLFGGPQGSPRSDKLISARFNGQRLSCGRLIMFSRAEGQFTVAPQQHRLYFLPEAGGTRIVPPDLGGGGAPGVGDV